MEISNVTKSSRRVVIVGAGFAGLHCAKTLSRNEGLRVTLIDRHNYQQFQPLLYQVATGTLSPENAAFNLREIFAGTENVDIRTTEIVSVDVKQRSATDRNGNIFEGDYLVLAAGTEANFFHIPGAQEYALPMYSLQDAEKLRSRFLKLLDTSDLNSKDDPSSAISVVVIGGGATGVETAGAIADFFRRSPNHLFADLDLTKASITIVDMAQTVLPPFSSESQAYAKRILADRGVTLRLGTPVKEITQHAVILADGSILPARLIIWAGGLKAASLSSAVAIPAGHGGRLDVAPELCLPGHPNVFVLGDFANTKDASGGYLPQLGSVAQQAGRHCARNIIADVEGEPRTAFSYFDKGMMAMVGRDAAVAEVGPRHIPISGPLAFAAWLGVHAVLLTTARAQMEALVEWGWDYIAGSRVSAILDDPEETGAARTGAGVAGPLSHG